MPTKRKKARPKAKARPRKPSSAKAKASKKAKEKLIGKVAHFYDKISVAAMKLGDSLRVGDTVRIEGGSVAFTQQIASMQIEHEPVRAAKKGDEVGFKVKQKVREGYRVFKVA
jgi:putative protease